MCMFCAAIPVAGAVGAKLNSDQNHKLVANTASQKKPIAAITTSVIAALLVGSVVYHTTMFGK